MMDDRGATETLGFVLAFAIITAAIGIIYTAGFGGLQDARNAEQIENVERAFEVLAENLEDVRRYRTPSRSTEIRLLDGELRLGSQTQLRVNISGQSNPVTLTTMRPIVFESGDGDHQITYEGGALFRTDRNTSVMLSDPGWMVDGDRLVLPMVQSYRFDGPNVLDVRGTTLVVAHSVNQTVTPFTFGIPETVNLTVSSPRVDAWARYLESKGFTSFDTNTSDNTMHFKQSFDRIYLSTAIVGVELSE